MLKASQIQNIPRVLRDISVLLTGSLVTKIIGLAALMFYARVLSKAELAVFPIYLMLSELSLVLPSFGVMPTLIKTLPLQLKHDQDTARGLIYTSSTIVIWGTILVSVAAYIFSPDISRILLQNKIGANVVRIMTIGFVALSIGKLAEQVMWAAGRFGKKSLLNVLESIFKPTCTVVLFLTYGLVGIVVGLVLAQIIRSLLALYYIRDIVFKKSIAPYPVRSLLRQSMPFYFESFLMYFRREGDNWLVSTMLGSSTLAVYYIAKTVYANFFLIYKSIDQVITEKLAIRFHNDAGFKGAIGDCYRYITHSSIPIFLYTICILPILIVLLGGDRYLASITPSSILLAALLVQFLRIPVDRTIFIASKSENRVILTMVDTLFLFGGLLTLTPLFDVEGVAASRVVSQLGGGLFGLWFMHSKLKVILDLKPFLSSLATALPGTLILFYYWEYWEQSFGIFIAFLVITFFWFLGFIILSFTFNRDLFLLALRSTKTQLDLRINRP